MKLYRYVRLTMALAVFAAAMNAQAQSSAVSLPKTAPTKPAAPAATEAGISTPGLESAESSTAIAPGLSGTSTTKVKPPETTEEKPFSIGLGLEMAEKIQKDEVSPKENTLSMTIAPAYKINSNFNVSGKIVINQDNYAQHETTASDATISLGITGFAINEQLKSVHSIGTVAPLSDASVKRDRLKGNISISNGLAFTSQYIDITYKLGLGRNFHEFTQNAEGSPNIEYRISNLIETKIPVTEQFYLSAAGNYRYGRTYGGYERYSFIFDADINYDFTSKFSANIGTSNDGNALKANGVDSNIALYNENSSVVRAGVSYQY